MLQTPVKAIAGDSGSGKTLVGFVCQQSIQSNTVNADKGEQVCSEPAQSEGRKMMPDSEVVVGNNPVQK